MEGTDYAHTLLPPGVYDIHLSDTASGLDLDETHISQEEVQNLVKQERERDVELCELLPPRMELGDTYIDSDKVDQVFRVKGTSGVPSDVGEIESSLEDRNPVLLSGEVHGLCASDIARYLDDMGKDVVKNEMFPEHQLERL
jgi:hypothetical protein